MSLVEQDYMNAHSNKTDQWTTTLRVLDASESSLLLMSIPRNLENDNIPNPRFPKSSIDAFVERLRYLRSVDQHSVYMRERPGGTRYGAEYHADKSTREPPAEIDGFNGDFLVEFDVRLQSPAFHSGRIDWKDNDVQFVKLPRTALRYCSSAFKILDIPCLVRNQQAFLRGR